MKTFGAILRKSAQKYQENYWVFHSKLTTFRDLRGSDFSNGKTAICDIEKSCSQYIIKTVVYEDFWDRFAKRCTKVPRKPLGFHSKLMTFRDLRGIDFSNGKTAICDIEKKRSKTL